MKALKKILFVLAIIIVLVIVVGFFLPRHIHMERSLVMKAHPGLVYNQVDILKNWENWSPWQKKDTAMKRVYTGPSMGKDAAFSWDSKVREVGHGKLTILKDKPYDTVTVSIQFMDNPATTSHFIFEKVDEGTKVTWTFDADMGINPFSRYFGLFIEGMLGKAFAEGLEGMKKVVETNGNAMMIVGQEDVKETPYLYIRDKMNMESIGEKMGEFYPEIGAYAGMKNVAVAGAPFSISYTWEGTEWDVACGMPLASALAGEGRIQAGVLPGGKVITCDYYGAYEGTGLPHQVVNEWITQNNKKIIGQPWESYLADPMADKNPEKWLTRVYYPVE